MSSIPTVIESEGRTPATWDEACDAAVQAVIGSIPWSNATSTEFLREHIDQIVAQGHMIQDRDDLPMMLTSMAVVARNCLKERGSLPSIEQITRILADKQASYGPQNILQFGNRGLIIRVADKVARIENMLDKGRESDVEPLDDAYLDIIGYAVISVMLAEGWFELPLARDLMKDADEEFGSEAKEGTIDTITVRTLADLPKEGTEGDALQAANERLQELLTKVKATMRAPKPPTSPDYSWNERRKGNEAFDSYDRYDLHARERRAKLAEELANMTPIEQFMRGWLDGVKQLGREATETDIQVGLTMARSLNVPDVDSWQRPA